MAVVSMQRIHICALRKDRKAILEALQRKGVVEISDDSQDGHDKSAEEVFYHIYVSDSADQLQNNIRLAEQALEVLDEYAPEKKSLFSGMKGKEEVTSDEYDLFAKIKKTANQVAKRLVALAKGIQEAKGEIVKLEQQKDALEPWEALDVPLNFKGTKRTSAIIGLLPGTWTAEQIYEEFGLFTPFDLEIISVMRDQTCIFILCVAEQYEAMFEALRVKGFARPVIQTTMPPKKQAEAYEQNIVDLNQQIEDSTAEIASLSEKRDMLKFFYDYENMRSDKYEVIDHLLQSDHVFFLNGYIPKKEAAEMVKYLESSYDLDVQVENPDESEDVPVLLSNKGFAEPMESIVESYNVPTKGEIDPTAATAIAFYVLFGMMFSDAVYGFLMAALIGILLIKFPKMQKGTKNFLKMFMFCGISTLFWGVMFGSYCGDAVDVISKTFFGKQVTIPPVLFFPTEEPMRMLVLAICLGIVHIYTGLLIKLIQCIKAKKILDGIYDAVFWMVLVGSLIVLLLTSEMGAGIIGMEPLPAIAGDISIILAALAAVGIILTAGRESKNPGKRLLKGFYGLYGVTSYLNDIMSYSRLLALGIATGVIGSVFNMLGTMFGGGVLGVIFFIPIFVVGHLLNFGINILGAYVHTTRLQYVEFFNKFFEGGGRKFQPFAEKTKFYQVK